jgi:hypothetical protein
MAALDDIPPWAVVAAIRRWYRGEAGNDEGGKIYDCSWCPAPADLRRLAKIELWHVKQHAHVFDNLLRAEPLIEFGTEHCAAMRCRINNLLRSLGSSPPVGADGSGGAVSAS